MDERGGSLQPSRQVLSEIGIARDKFVAGALRQAGLAR